MIQSVIVITGGSSGFGRAAAKRFAEKGETVIITGRKAETLRPIADEYGTDYFQADVTSFEDWQKLYDYVIGKYGKIDLLLNNAGGGINIVPLTEQTREDIDASIGLNLVGPLYGCKVFVPKMIEQNSGTIINVASVCARLGWPGYSILYRRQMGHTRFFEISLHGASPPQHPRNLLRPWRCRYEFRCECGKRTRGSPPALKG